jgi:hypothetical protein
VSASPESGIAQGAVDLDLLTNQAVVVRQLFLDNIIPMMYGRDRRFPLMVLTQSY